MRWMQLSLLALFALATLTGTPRAAAAGPIESCRTQHSLKRMSAIERWRGPRANANRYPLYCEHAMPAEVIAVPERPPGLPSTPAMGFEIPAFGGVYNQPPASSPPPGGGQ